MAAVKEVLQSDLQDKTGLKPILENRKRKCGRHDTYYKSVD